MDLLLLMVTQLHIVAMVAMEVAIMEIHTIMVIVGHIIFMIILETHTLGLGILIKIILKKTKKGLII